MCDVYIYNTYTHTYNNDNIKQVYKYKHAEVD